jgi:hypothetical protein
MVLRKNRKILYENIKIDKVRNILNFLNKSTYLSDQKNDRQESELISWQEQKFYSKCFTSIIRPLSIL